ncbi:MAG: BrnA antitoxin family protein [Acidobacteria bacterium]|nr:BrnA antitoxin family protein [Acidobacteriota bacterium]
MKKAQRDKQIDRLRRMKDKDIDLSDIPEITDWSKVVVGKFYRPIKKPLTIRVDADVLAWLKSQGKGYQTRINSLLREAMQHSPRR